MSLTLDRFWKLLADSRLLDADEVGKLADASSKAQSNGGATPDKIAKWLVGKSRISAYQAKILLSGRTGPFFYGDYQIYDRIETGRLAGVFRDSFADETSRVPVLFVGRRCKISRSSPC